MDFYSRAPVPICEEVTPVNISKEPRATAAVFLEDSTPQGSTHALFVCISFHVKIEQTNQNDSLLLFYKCKDEQTTPNISSTMLTSSVAKKYHLGKEQLMETYMSKGYCVAVNSRIATSVLEPSHL